MMRRSFIVHSQLPPEQLVSSIRAEVHDVDPQQAIASVASMDELLDKSVALPRLNVAFLAAFRRNRTLARLRGNTRRCGLVRRTACQRDRRTHGSGRDTERDPVAFHAPRSKCNRHRYSCRNRCRSLAHAVPAQRTLWGGQPITRESTSSQFLRCWFPC
jgi:hypothetical protein